jgi:hypothetical protein
MADTTSQMDAPATPPNGQAAPASGQAPQSPQTQAPASTDKPDVVKVEDFRRMQSVLTQREQAAARAAQQANAQLQAMQQRLAQLETRSSVASAPGAADSQRSTISDVTENGCSLLRVAGLLE